MRDAFIDELCLMAQKDPSIVLVVGDLGYGVIDKFVKKFPKRFFNAGVAEQNMMSLSAGLASEGYRVFVYSIANFPTFRCAEQIRNDVDYHNLPVTIVAVGGGLSYGNLGYSHHAVQDYALMRCMPNMLLACPGDALEVRACMDYLWKNPQPSYLRLAKSGERVFHKHIPEVSPGVWLSVNQKQSEKVFLSTGGGLDIVFNRISAHPELINHAVMTLPLWGMKWKEPQKLEVERYSSITTVEDHWADGGFGSWLLESLINSDCDLSGIRINSLSVDSVGSVGSQSTLMSKFMMFSDEA